MIERAAGSTGSISCFLGHRLPGTCRIKIASILLRSVLARQHDLDTISKSFTMGFVDRYRNATDADGVGKRHDAYAGWGGRLSGAGTRTRLCLQRRATARCRALYYRPY